MNKSVSTINAPEFINLQPMDINPLMSKCEIKVLYLGENRNRSYISKEVALEMAKTLRGAPIVGYFKESKADFDDHGERVVIDNDGIKFECLTRPYGFVAPDAQVWFQTFEDTNDFGETIVREYLMTTGFLWTGQYEECKSAVEGEGKPQSMELDEDTCQGSWEVNSRGMEFFIINDAIFSKLCILGDDVEPCFEGSSIKAPEVSASFAKVDDAFKQTLFSMMQDLQFALKGGQPMDDNQIQTEPVVDTPIVTEEPVITEEPVVTEEPIVTEEPVVDEPSTEPVIEPEVETEPAPEVEPVAEPIPEGEPAPVIEPEVEPDPIVTEEPVATEPDQFELLQVEHTALQEKFTELETVNADLAGQVVALTAELTELRAYRAQVEEAEKDAMIQRFSMLSDEDKQDVVANKARYTVGEIEEKLSVICFRKKVIFDSDNSSKIDNKTEPTVTFSYGNVGTSEPAWITAVKNIKKNRN